MKKTVSLLLTFLMVVGLAMPVSGQVIERARFMAALSATYNQLERELAPYMAHQRTALQILQQLRLQPHEFVSMIDLDSTLASFTMRQDVQIDRQQSIFRSNVHFGVDVDIADINEIIQDVSFNTYLDNDIVAIKVPTLSDNYLYINRNITPAQWAQSDISEFLSFSDALELISSADSIHTMLEALTNMDLEFPEAALDAIRTLTNRHIFGASFSSQQGLHVPSSAGNIVTERITATMRSGAVLDYFNDLANLIESNQDIHEWLESWESVLDISAQEMQAMMGEAIRSINFSGTLNIHAYIASNGLAVRQVLEFDMYDANIIMYLNLLGQDFLINEAAFGVVFESEMSSGEIGFRATGDNVFSNGILDTQSEVFATLDGVQLFMLSADSFININETSDNITLSMSLDVLDFPTITAQGGGTYLINTQNNTFFTDITISTDLDPIIQGAGVAELRLVSLFQPITSITSPTPRTNITDITLDSPEFESIFLFFMSH